MFSDRGKRLWERVSREAALPLPGGEREASEAKQGEGRESFASLFVAIHHHDGGREEGRLFVPLAAPLPFADATRPFGDVFAPQRLSSNAN